MMRLGFKLARKKPVRGSAQSGLAASAAVPDSGFVFVQNSQGASAALRELSGTLSGVLELIDFDDESEDGRLKSQLRRLESTAGSYSNSSSASCPDLVEWEGSQSLAQIVAVAFNCAATVYKRAPRSMTAHDTESLTQQLPEHRRPHAPGVVFTEQEYVGPSHGGTEKAMGVWMAESKGCEEMPALVIAVRGTAKVVDAMVNANGRPIPAADFLGVDQVPLLRNTPVTGLSAHGGFLNSARALHASIGRHLSKADKDKPGLHVIFTGHSAGGAVASLLYLKGLFEAVNKYPSLKLSCITFGAPPTVTTDVTRAVRAAPELTRNHGHALAFVNEFDIVPRVDQVYLRSIVDLYRAGYNLAPMMNAAVPPESRHIAAPVGRIADLANFLLPPLQFEEGEEEEERQNRDNENGGPPDWRLPQPEYHIVGDVVLLRKDRVSNTAGNGFVRVLRAFSLPLADYQKLLYCGTETHSRTYYNDRVGLLQQGMFNSRQTW